MHEVQWIIGGCIILVTLLDAFWTTIWIDGGSGPITSRLTNSLWFILLKLTKRKHRVLG